MNSIILLFLIVIPSTSALVDCKTACRSCRLNSEPESMMEVYCAMCEECKARRRDKLRMRTQEEKIDKYHETTKESKQSIPKSTTRPGAKDPTPGHENPNQNSEPEDKPVHQLPCPKNPPLHLHGHRAVPVYPSVYQEALPYLYHPVSYPVGCPTAPPCLESEEEYHPHDMKSEEITLPTTTTTEISTTTTTSTLKPSTTTRHCKKKPRNRCPEIRYMPVPTPRPIPPYPCMIPCVPPMMGAACPCPQYPPPSVNGLPYQEPPIFAYKTTSAEELMQLLKVSDSAKPYHISTSPKPPELTTKNFFYVYVGVPKTV